MRDEAEKQIGHLYPKVKITAEMAKDRPDLAQCVGQELLVIAWLWARTVASPNPACGGKHVPLVKSFSLSKKAASKIWVQAVVDRSAMTYHFAIRSGHGEPPAGTVNRRGAICLLSGTPIPLDYVRSEGRAGRMGSVMMAIVVEGPSGRIYLPPSLEQEQVARQAKPENVPDTELPREALGFRVQNYGLTHHRDLFSIRQLAALTTLSDLVVEACKRVMEDARLADLPDDPRGLTDGGCGLTAYAGAVATYLGLGVDKLTDYNCALVTWIDQRDQAGHAFTKQTLSMVWD
jgi:putative DNA methylase